MNQINKQIDRAHRRLFLIQLAESLCLCLFTGLTLSVIAMAIPKVWHLSFLTASIESQWNWIWLGGGLALGLISAVIVSLLRQGSRLNTAIEVDNRFGLKERLSSALALSENDRTTEAGQALVSDAVRRAESIEVAEHFQAAAVQKNVAAAYPCRDRLDLGLCS